MIPMIGLMIGAYIIARSLEMLATTDRIQIRWNRAVVTLASMVALIAACFGSWELVMSSTNLKTFMDPSILK